MQRRCVSCPRLLPETAPMHKFYCGDCRVERQKQATNRMNHRRALKRTYSRMLKSLGNNLHCWINVRHEDRLFGRLPEGQSDPDF